LDVVHGGGLFNGIEVETYCQRLTKWHVRRALKWIGQGDMLVFGNPSSDCECPYDPESPVQAYLRGFTPQWTLIEEDEESPVGRIVATMSTSEFQSC